MQAGFSRNLPPSLMENSPRNILYATSARIGGVGLDAVACETLRGIQDRLGKAIAFGVRAPGFDRSKIVTLAWHPVRLLSNLDRKYYYPAKKKALDRVASRMIRRGGLICSMVGRGRRCDRFASRRN